MEIDIRARVQVELINAWDENGVVLVIVKWFGFSAFPWITMM